jgi:hypothetical protein
MEKGLEKSPFLDDAARHKEVSAEEMEEALLATTEEDTYAAVLVQ